MRRPIPQRALAGPLRGRDPYDMEFEFIRRPMADAERQLARTQQAFISARKSLVALAIAGNFAGDADFVDGFLKVPEFLRRGAGDLND